MRLRLIAPYGSLFAEALKQLGRAEDDPEIAAAAAGLRAPLHENCTLSPTQFAEKFGLPPPAAQPLSSDPSTTAAAAVPAAANEKGDGGKEKANVGKADDGSRGTGEVAAPAPAETSSALPRSALRHPPAFRRGRRNLRFVSALVILAVAAAVAAALAVATVAGRALFGGW